MTPATQARAARRLLTKLALTYHAQESWAACPPIGGRFDFRDDPDQCLMRVLEKAAGGPHATR